MLVSRVIDTVSPDAPALPKRGQRVATDYRTTIAVSSIDAIIISQALDFLCRAGACANATALCSGWVILRVITHAPTPSRAPLRSCRSMGIEGIAVLGKVSVIVGCPWPIQLSNGNYGTLCRAAYAKITFLLFPHGNLMVIKLRTANASF